MSFKSLPVLSPSKRTLLLGALATAVTLATPQSRLLAAGNKGPVKLALRDGKILEIRDDRAFLLDDDKRRPVQDGVFSLAGGGRVEVRKGAVYSAAMGPGDIFAQATWIQIHATPGGSVPRPGAKNWLNSNAKERPGSL